MKRFFVIVVLVVSFIVSLVHQASAQEAEEQTPTKESVLQRLNETQLTLDRDGWVAAVKELNKLNGKEESEEVIQSRADNFFGKREPAPAPAAPAPAAPAPADPAPEPAEEAQVQLDLVELDYAGILFEFFKLGICTFSATIGMSCIMHFVKYVFPFYVTLSIACEAIMLLYIAIQCFAFWATYQTTEGCTASLFITMCMCAGAGKFLYVTFIRPFMP